MSAARVCQRVKRRLWKVMIVRWCYNVGYHGWHDVRTGRAWSVLCVGLANLLPDWQLFAFVRPWFWQLAGALLADPATTAIRKNVFVEHAKRVRLGAHVFINRDTYIGSRGQVTIGNHVTISVGCRLLTISHAGAYHEQIRVEDIALKDHSIVYAGAMILPGAVVEPYVVIAAGAVLRGATRPGGVYAGVPARFIGYRTDVDARVFAGEKLL